MGESRRLNEALKRHNLERALLEIQKKPKDVAFLDIKIAQILQELEQWQSALGSLEQAREFFESTDDELGVATRELNIGTVLHRLGRLNRAREHFDKARTIYGRKEPSALADVDCALGVALLETHEPAEALTHLDRAQEAFAKQKRLEEAAGCAAAAVRALRDLGKVREAQVRENDAKALWESAKRLG
jgi:tetratricopeptide (TPR) repeat protein